MAESGARAVLRRFTERNTVRIAVTGLRRCGKTVFTTSAVHNLLRAGQWPEALPFLKVTGRGDLIAAEVSPLPGLPPFPFEDSLAAITGGEHAWPRPTDRLSGLRIALRYRTRRPLARLRGPRVRVLNVDLVDYPGEWLLDLPLMAQDFAAWSAETLARASRPPRAALFEPWRAYVDGLDAAGPADPAVLDRAAEMYAEALRAAAAPESRLFLNQPARVVRPGEREEGDPLLKLSPLPAPANGGTGADTLHGAMARRFEAYRRQVVGPFYRRHFRHFEAQIVLVDVLAALKGGEESFDDMRAAIAATLQSFDYARSGLRAWLESARTRRVVFAATKADHVSSNQHPNLRRLLEEVVARESNRIRFRGVATSALALSSVRCTEDVLGEVQGQTLSMVRGLPAGRETETALFPGEIPAHFPGPQDWRDGRFRFLDFLPARVSSARGLPQIGLDLALEALIGDRLR